MRCSPEVLGNDPIDILRKEGEEGLAIRGLRHKKVTGRKEGAAGREESRDLVVFSEPKRKEHLVIAAELQRIVRTSPGTAEYNLR